MRTQWCREHIDQIEENCGIGKQTLNELIISMDKNIKLQEEFLSIVREQHIVWKQKNNPSPIEVAHVLQDR